MSSQNYNVFAYRYNDKSTKETAQIWSVGWEYQTSHLYNWKGKSRKEESMYVFQYTVSGAGAIEIHGKEHKLTAGKVFLIDISEEYRYYLPKDSDHWEFIFITLYGKAVEKCWEYIRATYKSVLHLQADSTSVQHLFDIYQMAFDKAIKNAYQASSLAYHFVMELYQNINNLGDHNLPEAILQATVFAKSNYNRPIGPDDMAVASSLSRYHFTRLFKKTTGLTPIQYLTNIRILKGAELLFQTKYSIEEISLEIGFANANYFTKVFKRSTGMTPGEFRKNNILPNDDIFI